MLKVLAILVIAGGIFYLSPAGNALKTRVVSVVNPSASETQTLTTLKTQLNSISTEVSQPAFEKLSPSQQSQKLQSLVGAADQTLQEAQDTANKTDLSATLSSVIKNTLPANWTGNSCQK